MRAFRWNEHEFGALCEESARRRYPVALYQVHLREMKEPAMMTGAAPARTLIGLEGSFLLESGGERALVSPGDVVEVGAGEFVFRSQGPVVFLAVYRLPPELVLN
jgi:hypothetical protein